MTAQVILPLEILHCQQLFAGKTLVSFVSYFCELFCLLEKFCCRIREELVKRCEANLTLEEVLELGPVWLLAVE